MRKRIYLWVALAIMALMPFNVGATGFFNVVVIDSNQLNGDSVRVAYSYITVQSPAKFFSENIVKTDSFITVSICLGLGAQTQGVVLYDTLNLGPLPEGSCKATIHMYKTALFDTLCTLSYWYDSVQVSFNVSSPTGILREDDMSTFRLYQPSQKILKGEFTQAFEQNTFVDIYDVSGRKMVGKPFIHTNYFEVDVSTFPAGVYLVAIQNEKISVVKRWTKQ